jgi:hypothetical protein
MEIPELVEQAEFVVEFRTFERVDDLRVQLDGFLDLIFLFELTGLVLGLFYVQSTPLDAREAESEGRFCLD